MCYHFDGILSAIFVVFDGNLPANDAFAEEKRSATASSTHKYHRRYHTFHKVPEAKISKSKIPGQKILVFGPGPLSFLLLAFPKGRFLNFLTRIERQRERDRQRERY